MRQSRLMSLAEAMASVVVGLIVAVATQIGVFPARHHFFGATADALGLASDCLAVTNRSAINVGFLLLRNILPCAASSWHTDGALRFSSDDLTWGGPQCIAAVS